MPEDFQHSVGPDAAGSEHRRQLNATSVFQELAAAQASGRLSERERPLLEALAPFAHYGELDGTVKQIASLFPHHVRDRIQGEFKHASLVFRALLNSALSQGEAATARSLNGSIRR